MDLEARKLVEVEPVVKTELHKFQVHAAGHALPDLMRPPPLVVAPVAVLRFPPFTQDSLVFISVEIIMAIIERWCCFGSVLDLLCRSENNRPPERHRGRG